MFEFCPYCGNKYAELVDIRFKNFRDCEKCGKRYYFNQTPAAGIILRDKKYPGKVGLCRRGINPGKGKLCIMGGFNDMGEIIEKTALREAKEELCLDLKPNEITFVGSIVQAYNYNGNIKQVLTTIFEVELNGRETKASDDCVEVVWLSKHELSTEDLAFPEQLEFLQNHLN